MRVTDSTARARARARATRARTRAHARTRTHTHALTHARKQEFTHERTHALTHAHMHSRTHARTHTSTHACTHVSGNSEENGFLKLSRVLIKTIPVSWCVLGDIENTRQQAIEVKWTQVSNPSTSEFLCSRLHRQLRTRWGNGRLKRRIQI